MVNTQSCISFTNSFVPWPMLGAAMPFCASPFVCSIVADWIWPFLFYLFFLWPCVLEPCICAEPSALLLGGWFIIFLFVHYQIKCCKGRVHWSVSARGRKLWFVLQTLLRCIFVLFNPMLVISFINLNFCYVIVRIILPTPGASSSHKARIIMIKMFLACEVFSFFHLLDFCIFFFQRSF